MRYSRQREAVYNVLCSTDSHPDVAYVYSQVRKIIPSISLGTVYRNLAELCKAGRVRKLGVSYAERYDANVSEHSHFVCTECGRICDLPAARCDAECDCGKVDRIDVVLYGLCCECQSADAAENIKGGSAE